MEAPAEHDLVPLRDRILDGEVLVRKASRSMRCQALCCSAYAGVHVASMMSRLYGGLWLSKKYRSTIVLLASADTRCSFRGRDDENRCFLAG